MIKICQYLEKYWSFYVPLHIIINRSLFHINKTRYYQEQSFERLSVIDSITAPVSGNCPREKQWNNQL